ncbi:LMBR1 domain-containing protein [Apiospora kogelbergensis]|uniref:LMBR1 domain-containing protein n=1 Tax=Apiospora kogelbergensis TaxID=1337665 RepID=UPI00312D6D9A
MMEPAVPCSREENHKSHPYHHHRRRALPGLLFGAFKPNESGQYSNASLGWKIESPPVVLHGDAQNSTGVLVSGQLLLAVRKAPCEIESFKAWLQMHVIQKRPYQRHCPDCINQKMDLKNWTVLEGPAALNQGLNEFPFSFLLEGHLPATTDNSVIAVKYEFTIEVKLKHGLYYSQVIHPNEINKLQLRLEGFVKTSNEVNSVEYWTLKRLSWKLEEHLNTIAPACTKHLPSTKKGHVAMKGIERVGSRTVGSADLSTGWKLDYSPNGYAEMEIEYQCNNSCSKPVCGMKTHDDINVTHQLVLQLVVVQEFASINRPKHANPTGVARILRMHLGMTLTERASLSVSCENEAPPIYKDVPPSPPLYEPPSNALITIHPRRVSN